jgi:hypothetical protein
LGVSIGLIADVDIGSEHLRFEKNKTNTILDANRIKGLGKDITQHRIIKE